MTKVFTFLPLPRLPLARRARLPALALMAVPLMALSACTSPYDIAATSCDPAQHQALVGRNVGEIMLPPNLRKREVGPEGAMTRDFNPARLTMHVDPKGWVRRVECV